MPIACRLREAHRQLVERIGAVGLILLHHRPFHADGAARCDDARPVEVAGPDRGEALGAIGHHHHVLEVSNRLARPQVADPLRRIGAAGGQPVDVQLRLEMFRRRRRVHLVQPGGVPVAHQLVIVVVIGEVDAGGRQPFGDGCQLGGETGRAAGHVVFAGAVPRWPRGGSPTAGGPRSAAPDRCGIRPNRSGWPRSAARARAPAGPLPRGPRVRTRTPAPPGSRWPVPGARSRQLLPPSGCSPEPYTVVPPHQVRSSCSLLSVL